MAGSVAVAKGSGGRYRYLCTMSYTERAMDAERRLRRGERQLFCPECGRWRWPDECAHEGRLTERQFTAAYGDPSTTSVAEAMRTIQRKKAR